MTVSYLIHAVATLTSVIRLIDKGKFTVHFSRKDVMKAVVSLGSIVVGLAAIIATTPVEARDRVLIVGSSTVYPFANEVVNALGNEGDFKFPILESTGSGTGFSLFCSGVGPSTPDITNASRRMKPSELETCRKNGVTPVEIEIGYDGIVMANSSLGPKFGLSLQQVFFALAEQTAVDGVLAANPNHMWSDIDPSLPAEKIEVFGPPPTSGTRDAFEELAMEPGCEAAGGVPEDNCTAIRFDGAFLEAGENDTLIVNELDRNPLAVGIFGYSFLDQNADHIQSATINGVEPTFENITSGAYPMSRSLYFYIKAEHVGVTPGIEDYVAVFTSEEAWGDDGYLVAKGLIPLTAGRRAEMSERARLLSPLQLAN